MCGRVYQTYTEEELYFQYLNKRPLIPLQLTPVYNLCPTQDSPVLRIVEGERRFEQMRWQLVSNREPAFNTKLSTINAKSETAFDSPLFGELIIRRRCIVPISGFFEWKADGRKKRPFKIQLQNGAIMSVAGIWDTWRPGTPLERRSFSILTTAANRFMREIHDRMPVILDQKVLDDWLNPETHEPQELKTLMKPCPDEWLAASEVSALVNSPQNNSPELLEPASSTDEPDREQGHLFED
ncbi:MAG TPA: SOS response-associated peptidase [Terriglobia bacterium]|jgi:putative SOS response-associated peptidase YedK